MVVTDRFVKRNLAQCKRQKEGKRDGRTVAEPEGVEAGGA